MKSSMMRWMIAAAALAVAAGSASAQTMKADIELTFRAGSTLMQPGNYEVKVNTMNSTVIFHNLDTNKSAVLIVTEGKDAPKEWRVRRSPVIAFACSADRKCVLSRMWNGREQYQRVFHSSDKAHGENLAEVLVPLSRAD